MRRVRPWRSGGKHPSSSSSAASSAQTDSQVEPSAMMSAACPDLLLLLLRSDSRNNPDSKRFLPLCSQPNQNPSVCATRVEFELERAGTRSETRRRCLVRDGSRRSGHVVEARFVSAFRSILRMVDRLRRTWFPEPKMDTSY
ncbi:hypothetical protein Q8A73_021755 [Channa argus]|nr:hypothetical protein Q8A73_021755 [Channa argus]